MGGTTFRLTYQDYLAIPPDGKRHEIVEGEEYVSPAPRTLHQAVVGRLLRSLHASCTKRGGLVFVAPTDVLLSDEDVVQPDLLYIAPGREDIVKENYIEGAPDLLIEIISESSRRLDEMVKRRRYERFGVGEYWILDPDLAAAKVYRLGAGKGERRAYGQPELYAARTRAALVSPLFPGLRLPLRRLFADPRRP